MNFILYGSFTVYSLCRSREDRFQRSINFIILAPFLSLFLSATLATYYALSEGSAACIYYGTIASLLTNDVEHTIIFMIGIYFVFSMMKVLKMIMLIDR